MNTKVIITISLIIITKVTGTITHKTGKPYSPVFFTLHKMTSIGFIIFKSIILVNYIRNNGLGTTFCILLALGTGTIISLFFSGAMLSLDKIPDTMISIHKISTLGFLVYIFIIFFIILRNY